MKKRLIKAVAALLTLSIISSCTKDNTEDSSGNPIITGPEGVIHTDSNSASPAEVVAIYPYADVYDAYNEVVIEGNSITNKENLKFKGIGVSLTNEEGEALNAYKEHSPEEYDYIINLLFGAEGSVGITHIKLPLSGSDLSDRLNCVVAKDALSVNQNLTFELFYTGTESDFDARVAAITEISQKLKVSGISVSYISSEDSGNADWIKHLSDALKQASAPDAKIIAADYNGSLSEAMTKDITLLDSVDVLCGNIPTETAAQLSDKYNKEIWSSYSAADFPQEDIYNANVDLPYNIIRDINYNYVSKVIIDNPVSSNIEVPALLVAEYPEDGTVEIDASLWHVANISLFTQNGYQPVTTAGYEQNPENDFQFVIFANNTTGDYTIVAVNRSPRASAESKLTFTTKRFEKGADLLHHWGTRGMTEGDFDYYDNFFQLVDEFYPVDYGLDKYTAEMEYYDALFMDAEDPDELPEQIVPYSFSVSFDPYTVSTITTENVRSNTVDAWDVYSEIVY